MQLPYEEELNIERFSHIFDKKSESYKLFWFKAIMTKVCEGKSEMTFNELINIMIIDAWYMVTEYHLNLGPSDNLEAIVGQIHSISKLASTAKQDKILRYLNSCDDKVVCNKKSILIQNVPYRLQAPLLTDVRGNSWNTTPKALATKINQEKGLLYNFVEYDGLNSRIRINDDWKLYLIKNQEIIKCWIDYNMIIYLQRRNPSVPGISDKLYPPITAKLNQVREYWECIATISGGVNEIYFGTLMHKGNITIDHFVPWSFVAHDELWNLSPTTREINSMKSNNLANWEEFFPKLAQIEYDAYRIMRENDYAKAAFEKCAEAHVSSSEIKYKLYIQENTLQQFANQLEEIILPVYNTAKNCGFAEWVCA